jgi:hypothetical protein
MLSHMPRRRRGATDALDTSRETRWLVVRDLVRRPLEYRELWPGADLRAAMAAKRTELEAAGWQAESIPKNCAFFFAGRENERVCVSMECYEPGHVPVGHGSVIGKLTN